MISRAKTIGKSLFILTIVGFNLLVGIFDTKLVQANTILKNQQQVNSGNTLLEFVLDRYTVRSEQYRLDVQFVDAHSVMPQSVSGATYADRIEYANLWDGVSVLYEFQEDKVFKSTYFVDASEVNAAERIKLAYSRPVQIDAQGNLVINFDAGNLIEAAPIAWQDLPEGRRMVDVQYQILEGNQVGFKVGQYAQGYPLVIDPDMIWNTFLGSAGSENTEAQMIEVMGDGGVVVAGYSDVTWGAPIRAHAGTKDGYVVRLDKDGNIVWSTFLGGAGLEVVLGLQIDTFGNIYVSGYSSATWGSPLSPYVAGNDAFLAKLDSSGNLLWNTFYTAAGDDLSNRMKLDANNNIFIVGRTNATWGPAPINPISTGYDGYLAKFDSNGALQWNTFFGGAGTEFGRSLEILSDGSLVVVGSTNITWGSPIRAFSGGSNDILVAKFNVNGQLIWNTFLGGAGADSSNELLSDSQDNIYIGGTCGTTWGSPLNPYTGGNDICLIKLSTNGSIINNSFWGSTGADTMTGGLALDVDHSLYIGGLSIQSWGTPIYGPHGVQDGILAKINSDGSLAWNMFVGTSAAENFTGVALDGHGNLYAQGAGMATFGNPIRAYSAGLDSFLVKFDVTAPNSTDDVNFAWSKTNVSVGFSCSDNQWGTGCQKTYYTTDGSIPTTSSSFGNSLVLINEGQYSIKYFSDDFSLNYESVKTSANTVKIDKTAPIGSVIFANASTFTTVRGVSLDLAATDVLSGVNQMLVSESASFAGANWEAFATQKSITLSAGDGSKNIYVKYKDLAGNESVVYSTNIVLDATAPTIRITDIGLISGVPDKAQLLYYFTSQTPRIKGVAEANAVVHFKYLVDDYITIADVNGRFEIVIPQLPRQLVDLEYYALDSYGNQSGSRTLTLIIGEENFPQITDPVITPTMGVLISVTPTITIVEIPNVSGTPDQIPRIYEFMVLDRNGQPIADTVVSINGQEYRTNKFGRIFLENPIPAGAKILMNIAGTIHEGEVQGSNIRVGSTSSPELTETAFSWWWVCLPLLMILIIAIVVYYYRHKFRSSK